MQKDEVLSDPHINSTITQLMGNEKVIAIVIYGSYLKQDQFRDIDLCLFTEPGLSILDLVKDFGNISEIFDIKLFNELPLYIQIRVLNDGVILFQRNYDQIFEIYMRTLKEWDLFEPHFNRYLEAVRHG